MNEHTKESYSNRFKAKVALEGCSGKSVHELSDKYTIPPEKIEAWIHQLNDRAELLFVDGSDTREAFQTHSGLLRTVIETSPNGILVTSLDREVITYNQNCISMWEMPRQVEKQKSLKQVMSYILNEAADPEKYKKIIEDSYANPDRPSSYTVELRDGRFFERTAVPCKVGNETIGLVIHFVDISHFKETEGKLSEFSNLLQSINTNVHEGILRSTPDSGLVYVNEAFVRMFGYNTKEEVMATAPSAFYADPAVRHSLVNELEKEGQYINTEVLFKRRDGSTFWGLENCSFIKQDGKTYFDGVITDIHTRKKAEQELRKSEEKYRSILKNIEEGYFETNLQGDFTFSNAALVNMMGYPVDEMIGMNNRQYMDEEEAQKVFNTFNKVYRTGKPQQVFDWELIQSDDSRIYVEASVTLRQNSRGKPIGFSGMVRNITERKRKQKQIEDSLKEKEVLLGEIHHRVKNNLAVISGLLYLQADKTMDENASSALMQSQNRINSMALIHELLYDNQTFSSLNPRVYIKQLVEHISSNLQQDESNITTSIHAENFDLEMSAAIPCALIINELITNAFKYAFANCSKGKLEIIFHKLDDGAYRLVVADNGCGLPKGFDINDPNQHSLGLSLVKTLTQQLNGKLETKDASGTRFIITFDG